MTPEQFSTLRDQARRHLGHPGVRHLGGAVIKPTVRDISDTCTGLRGVVERLREAAHGKPLEGFTSPVVPASVSGLLEDAAYVESVVDELRRLIPEDEVQLD